MNSRVIYPQPHHADKSWIMPTSCGLWVLLWCYCPFGLGWSCIRICEFTFCFFFLFFFHAFQRVMRLLFMYCSLNSSRKCWLFHDKQWSMYCSRSHKLYFSETFSLKMSPTILFTHLKIILLPYFQFSIFSFSKISSIQTDP